VAVAIRPPDGTPCALALLADFESVYERVIQRWPVPSRTGTTGMVHRAGEEAVVLASPGGLENGGRSARVPLSARAVPAVQAALGATGVIQGVDLAHHPVMAAIRPIPGTDWRLVAKMDLAEIEAPILGPFAVIASLVAALLGAGAIVLVLWWRADVTRERMEEELRRSQSQLERAERLAEIGSLAAGVAHEINNPLAYVLANLDFLRSRLATPGADADLSEALEEARSGAERVRDVVRGLSAFSRPGTSARGPVDVSAQLQAALRLAANEIRHRARLETAIGPLPSVSATENELGQVFLNLLVNAAQAIPEGHAKENVIRVEASTDARGWARVEVRDTGAGMAPEVQRRIFEPFFTTKGGSGTGLGLAIAHGIVTAAGGRIEVESQNGSGSTFRVFLPPAGPASAPA
jgi:signal transduction histidine kinase